MACPEMHASSPRTACVIGISGLSTRKKTAEVSIGKVPALEVTCSISSTMQSARRPEDLHHQLHQRGEGERDDVHQQPEHQRLARSQAHREAEDGEKQGHLDDAHRRRRQVPPRAARQAGVRSPRARPLVGRSSR
jgi:hypothetical protein